MFKTKKKLRKFGEFRHEKIEFRHVVSACRLVSVFSARAGVCVKLENLCRFIFLLFHFQFTFGGVIFGKKREKHAVEKGIGQAQRTLRGSRSTWSFAM